jgi:hypothetical protein
LRFHVAFEGEQVFVGYDHLIGIYDEIINWTKRFLITITIIKTRAARMVQFIDAGRDETPQFTRAVQSTQIMQTARNAHTEHIAQAEHFAQAERFLQIMQNAQATQATQEGQTALTAQEQVAQFRQIVDNVLAAHAAQGQADQTPQATQEGQATQTPQAMQEGEAAQIELPAQAAQSPQFSLATQSMQVMQAVQSGISAIAHPQTSQAPQAEQIPRVEQTTKNIYYTVTSVIRPDARVKRVDDLVTNTTPPTYNITFLSVENASTHYSILPFHLLKQFHLRITHIMLIRAM